MKATHSEPKNYQTMLKASSVFALSLTSLFFGVLNIYHNCNSQNCYFKNDQNPKLCSF
jgi:hypothetical protein